MTFRDIRTGTLTGGRTYAEHSAKVGGEEATAQQLAVRLNELCGRGQFPDLTAISKVLAKPTGQSVVFQGVYRGRGVAVKVFRSAEEAATELAFLGKCVHANIMVKLCAFEYNGRTMLVMPLARGDLDQAIADRGMLDHGTAAAYAAQAADVLSFLHVRSRVAHLDLKPQNIFLAADDGRLLLADFGCSMDITGSSDEIVGRGTPFFMAPEVWADRQRGDRSKVDVYAFGCLLWHMLAGQPPFQREMEDEGWDLSRLAAVVLRERRSPAAMLDAHWPSALRRLIQTCCAHDAATRPSMAQVLRELRG